MEPSHRPPTVAVIGGGIAGLAAAYTVTRLEPDARVTLVEGSDRLGGKISSSLFAGVLVEEGPDAFLARVPDAVQLCREVGLGDDLVAPRTSRAYLWSGGRLRRIPAETFLGVPFGFASIAASGLLSAQGMSRASLDLVLPRTRLPQDPSVGELVRARFGDEVFARLVEPMLGGVYAGDAETLSASVVLPDVVRLGRSHRSLAVGLRAHRARVAGRGPVFLTVRGGLSRLVERLGAALERCDVRTGVRASTIARGRRGFHVRTPEGVPMACDAVIVATPSFAAASLLRSLVPAASAELDGIAYASVATVTLAYNPGALQRPLAGSGFLVPRVENKLIVGCTWMTSKWSHLASAGCTIIRCAVGRVGDERWMALSESDLVARVHGELVEAIGVREPPVESRVVAWERSMPQYVVGHPARLARIDMALADVPGVFLAGAGYRGIGLPACIAQGRAAAARAVEFVRSMR